MGGILGSANLAWANLEVAVEIDRRAERALNPRLTRRLIELELGELDVPPPVSDEGGTTPPSSHSLFVRVLGEDEDQLRVELWEHGVFHGARIVPLGEGTSEQLRARRVALTAATLGRRLRLNRLREAQAAAERARLAAEAEKAFQESPPPSRVALGAHLRGVTVGTGDLLLFGPGLEAQLRQATGERLDLGLSWLTGTAPRLDGSPAIQWMELSVAPGYVVEVSPQLDLVLGLEVAAATVHASDVLAVDDIAHQQDTWSARAVGRVSFEVDAGDRAHVRLGTEMGSSMRRIPVVDQSGDTSRLGGAWFGLTIGFELDPRAQRGPLVAIPNEPQEHVAAGPEIDSPSAPPRGNSAPHPPRKPADSPAP